MLFCQHRTDEHASTKPDVAGNLRQGLPAGKDSLLRLDPVITSTNGIERHHLFPRAYLSKKLGVSDPKKINQIANMALVEWNVNIGISDSAPSKYWQKIVETKVHLTEGKITE